MRDREIKHLKEIGFEKRVASEHGPEIFETDEKKLNKHMKNLNNYIVDL